jgi:hypothetical protein
MRAAIALDRVAGAQVGNAIRPHDLPVGAARQDAAGKPRAFDASAQDVDHAAVAVRRRAEMEDVGQLRVDAEDWVVRDHAIGPLLQAASRAPL